MGRRNRERIARIRAGKEMPVSVTNVAGDRTAIKPLELLKPKLRLPFRLK